VNRTRPRELIDAIPGLPSPPLLLEYKPAEPEIDPALAWI